MSNIGKMPQYKNLAKPLTIFLFIVFSITSIVIWGVWELGIYIGVFKNFYLP